MNRKLRYEILRIAPVTYGLTGAATMMMFLNAGKTTAFIIIAAIMCAQFYAWTDERMEEMQLWQTITTQEKNKR